MCMLVAWRHTTSELGVEYILDLHARATQGKSDKEPLEASLVDSEDGPRRPLPRPYVYVMTKEEAQPTVYNNGHD